VPKTETGTPFARPAPQPVVGDGVRGFARFLYTNNPFYVASAVLVFWGLLISFDDRGEFSETGVLMIGLIGYTLLMAVTAWLLIRLGRVWDDVRTLLLLMVLTFLAISVTFDKALTANIVVGRRYFLIGLVFAIVVSESLLRGIRLKLPALFRVPYYLILSLFYLYPVALAPMVTDLESRVMPWALFAFPSMAGVLFLTLLPAIRRGAKYLDDNGSPWPWPLYPWVLFGVLGLGVCGRSYYLCMSFHVVGSFDTIFRLYFLVPFLLAVNFLFLEIATVARRRNLQRLALALPFGLLALAMTGQPERLNDFGFCQLFVHTLGCSPLFLTLVGVGVFHAVASLRRAPQATEALTISLAALAFIGPQSVSLETFSPLRVTPIILMGILQLAMSLKCRDSRRAMLAACCFVGAATIELQDTSFADFIAVIPAHLLLASSLLIGALFKDDFARALQNVSAGAILLATMACMFADPRALGNPPPLVLDCYPLPAIAVALLYGYLVGNRAYYSTAVATACGWSVLFGWRGYQYLRQMVIGLDHIALGIAFFALAILVSLTKMERFRRWVARRFGASQPPPVPDTGGDGA